MKKIINFKKIKRILIVGDAGRGKSTFASKLSKKIKIKFYSTDDYYWAKKFTLKRDKEKSINLVNKIYKKDSWILEGATRHLVKGGFSSANLIIYMTHKSLLNQYYVLFRRFLKRDYERFRDFLDICLYLFMKKYRLGRHRHEVTIDEMLFKYRKKVIRLDSFRKVNEFLDGV